MCNGLFGWSTMLTRRTKSPQDEYGNIDGETVMVLIARSINGYSSRSTSNHSADDATRQYCEPMSNRIASSPVSQPANQPINHPTERPSVRPTTFNTPATHNSVPCSILFGSLPDCVRPYSDGVCGILRRCCQCVCPPIKRNACGRATLPHQTKCNPLSISPMPYQLNIVCYFLVSPRCLYKCHAEITNL